jgi:N6-L-threonylcarbamoyladenine synthase
MSISGETTIETLPSSVSGNAAKNRSALSCGRVSSSTGRCVFSVSALFAMACGVTCQTEPLQRKADMSQAMTILGLESSCDDTAAAIVRRTADGQCVILSSVVAGQTELHAAFGGVVPEIAARAHAEKLDHCVEDALLQAGVSLHDIDAIAVTAGPGLIGGVVSGVMCAKGLSLATEKPLYGINHLAGHALTPRLTDNVSYPYLMLLVSGGHCQFLMVRGVDAFHRLGGTIDDAPGEAFDKVARLIGLPQPGGPAIEQAAQSGDPTRFTFPRPLLDREGCDMSFSGLKTAVLRTRDKVVAEKGGLTQQDQADLAAGFQAAVVEVLVKKTRRALVMVPDTPITSLCVAGGVAANQAIRAGLETVSDAGGVDFVAPPLALCTDNAAMIAYAAIEQSDLGEPDDLTLSARPRWPLDKAQPAMLGSGKKGAKA